MEASFQRARRPEQKNQRRENILATAAVLAEESGVARISLGDIAAAVGLAKSNVLRYFGTREEIYLQLTMREGADWAHAAGAALRQASGYAGVATALADAYADRPLYCDLTTHAETMLEHNVSMAALRTYKTWAIDTYFTVGRLIAAACPELTVADGASLVMAGSAFVAKLFPVTRPPAALRELYEREPEIAGVFPPFRPTLQRMIAATAAGLPTTH
ncbi:TetR/AcrR family transcriptional regulator [Actinoplanes derwentensis]|uniref:Regulatory protein, tetR family n=1 Tax=Actinoplanes derwentensis TaxID=113562 RepID=A0A1H1X9V8_9ACTN|nr:TetR/AcrR family transcriptional regulator [Actinoplanes derwentensis]GID89609.1 TetR family transcriptional regulator [Actinoplanes derwentensis]SDT05850.1 regulatory protein, tetR family [Actinoplanes derwentensis]